MIGFSHCTICGGEIMKQVSDCLAMIVVAFLLATVILLAILPFVNLDCIFLCMFLRPLSTSVITPAAKFGYSH